MATPTVFNSAPSNPGGTGTTLTVILSTHAANDILLIYVAVTGNTTWTVPANYNLIDQRTVGTASTGIVGTWMWRKVLASDSLPLANPSCTLGATVTRAAVCITIRGADLEGPFTLPEWLDKGFATGTANPVRPPTLTTLAPNMLVIHGYGSRTATNAPEPTGYTQDQEVVISGTLTLNVAEQIVAANQTSLANQDASPTSGVRWAAGLICIPSPDYVYYRSGTQATATVTSVTGTSPTGTSTSDWRGNRDVVVANVEAAGSNVAITPQDATAWFEISNFSGTTSGSGTTVKKFWAYGTPNLQFNRPTSGEISVCLTTYRNCRQTNPIANSNARANASSTTSTWDAMDRQRAQSTVLVTVIADATPTFTFPGGWTERMDGLGIGCADQVFDATGTTASGSATLSAASPTAIGLVELISASQAVNVILPNNYQSVKTTMSVGERIR